MLRGGVGRCTRNRASALIVPALVLGVLAAALGGLPGPGQLGGQQRAAQAAAPGTGAPGAHPAPSVRAANPVSTPPVQITSAPVPTADNQPLEARQRPALSSPAASPTAVAAGPTARVTAVPRAAASGDRGEPQAVVGRRVPGRWPDDLTTGVPTGTTLRASGPLDITQDGAVVEGLDVDGCVTVRAKDVVIRASRITCPASDGRGAVPVRTLAGARGLLVEDVEIDGRGVASVAVCCTDYTLRRVEIHNVVDGPRLSDRTAVIDSWVHSLARVEGSHNDTLQTTGGRSIVVRGNSLQAWEPRSGDPMNAGFMIGSETAPAVEDLLFEGNLLNGGNYTVNMRKDMVARNVVFRGNVFGRDCRYGAVTSVVSGVRWDATNVWEDDGRPVTGSDEAEPASSRCSRRGA